MDIINKIGKKATETYKITAEKTSKIAKEAKLKMEINNCNSNIQELYTEIGKKIYLKYSKEEEITIEDINDELNKIDTLTDEINKSNDEIMKLKDKVKCKNCNYEMDDDFKYCPNCGAKNDN